MGEAKHTRIGPERDSVGIARSFKHEPGDPWPEYASNRVGTPLTWHTTKPLPWRMTARRRRRNRIARASRKINR